MRVYLPSLLPKFVALFGEAERGGGYDLVRPALGCLEALGTALEDHLPLLLPALVRLMHPSELGHFIPINASCPPLLHFICTDHACASKMRHQYFWLLSTI